MKMKETKNYHSDGRMICSCQYHIVFSHKYRRKVLIGDIEKRLKELIIEKQEQYEYKILDMEIMPDHVHLLLDIHPKNGVETIVNMIKGYTSFQLRKEFLILKNGMSTLWIHSKFISSVGAVTIDVVKKYMEEQKD